jgi:hypothetical protein
MYLENTKVIIDHFSSSSLKAPSNSGMKDRSGGQLSVGRNIGSSGTTVVNFNFSLGGGAGIVSQPSPRCFILVRNLKDTKQPTK